MSEQTGYAARRRSWSKTLTAFTAELLLGVWLMAGVVGPPGRAFPEAKTSSGRSQNPTSDVSADVTPEAARPESVAGRRDPFKIPPPPLRSPKLGSKMRGSALPGKRGLMIDQLKLEGVVEQDANHSMIAVVSNQIHRAYFLKAHDQLYDGIVAKITADAVYFNQNQFDANGQLVTREVVKKMGLSPGEGR